MDKSLDTYNLPRLNHEKIKNLAGLETGKDIESIIKSLPTKKSPGLDGFTGDFYQILEELLTPNLKLSKIEEGNTSKCIL